MTVRSATALVRDDGGGPFAASGWTDDGLVVRLTTITDTVAIGTVTMLGTEKVRVVGDIRLSGDVLPAADNTGNVGTDALRFARMRAFEIVSGDLGFEDEACPKCKKPFGLGEELVILTTRKEGKLTFGVPAHWSCPEEE